VHVQKYVSPSMILQVVDDGRGIPCAVHPTTGKSTLETVLCVLHAGGKFGGDASGYKVSGGLHGVGISVVNALSEQLRVFVTRDNTVHKMQFSRGVALGAMEMQPASQSDRRGTKVQFKPDPQIFKTTTEFEYDKLASRLDELAYLNAGITITMIDKRAPENRGYKNKIALQDVEDEKFDEAKVAAEMDAAKAPLKGKKAAVKSLIKTQSSNDSDKSMSSTPSSVVSNSGLPSSIEPKVEVFRHDGGIQVRRRYHYSTALSFLPLLKYNAYLYLYCRSLSFLCARERRYFTKKLLSL
jgi:DNA gyrase/topoisomerase IV subunit B